MSDHQELSVQNHLPSVLTPREYIVSVKHGDDTVLLNVETGRYFTLNPTGTSIWRWLCQGFSPEGIVSELQRVYEISPEAAKVATATLLRACAAASLFRETWEC